MSPTTEPPAAPSKLAVVLSGGGARGAYQAGVLRGIARHVPELRLPIITGVSAGAINAIFLAAHHGPLREATQQLGRVWEGIEFENVFRADFWSLARNSLLWMIGLGLGSGILRPKVHGLLLHRISRRF